MYHVAMEDKQEGPYDIRTIQQYISEGTIKENTLVWTEGQEDWVEASTVLGKYFNATPPPLPKKP